MSSAIPSDKFVGQLTAAQDELRAYILSCIGSYNDALDVLQATNVVLLKKCRDLPTQDDFLRWSTTVAKYEVLSYLRQSKRSGLVFRPELAELMSQVAEAKIEAVSARQAALKDCVSRLPDPKQTLLRLRYSQNLTTLEIARQLQRTENSIKVMLHRLRGVLHNCIEGRLQQAVLPVDEN